MAQQLNLPGHPGGLDPSFEGGPGKGFSFHRPIAQAGSSTEAWASAALATVRESAGHFGNERGAGVRARAKWLKASPSLLLCSASFLNEKAPECVRKIESGARWSELRGPHDAAASAAQDAIALLERLEGLLGALVSRSGDASAYQARLAEGLVHSLCDVLVELSDEANLVTGGTWQLLLLE